VGWLLEIVHETRVRYEGSARASYNEARMTPLSLSTQSALQTRVTVGGGTPVWAYRDYWGTLVSSFDIQAAHRDLTVRAHSMVETSAADHRAPGPGRGGPGRHRGRGPGAGRGGDLRVGGRPGGLRAGRDRGADSAQEAWDQGQGVCQDIAHLTVALLREAGLPARYVSGYLHPQPEAGIGQATAGQSRAWVEYWVGSWAAAGPTNQAPVGECHVIVARGRDYADVPPLKGIYHGAPSRAMDVTVEVTRLA
jgi:transglutaminase-like putative cysteine protease